MHKYPLDGLAGSHLPSRHLLRVAPARRQSHADRVQMVEIFCVKSMQGLESDRSQIPNVARLAKNTKRELFALP
jgi:hypothetical protein